MKNYLGSPVEVTDYAVKGLSDTKTMPVVCSTHRQDFTPENDHGGQFYLSCSRYKVIHQECATRCSNAEMAQV